METSTHRGREKEREKGAERRTAPLARGGTAEFVPPHTHTQSLTGVIVCLFVCFIQFPFGDVMTKGETDRVPSWLNSYRHGKSSRTF